jgi:hypothetical protein
MGLEATGDGRFNTIFDLHRSAPPNKHQLQLPCIGIDDHPSDDDDIGVSICITDKSRRTRCA